MIIDDRGNGVVLIAVKAVPGASRDEIAGVLGDRLKVRVSAPPEGGKANDAIRRLIADTLGMKMRDVTIVAGAASREKTARATGITAEEARRRFGLTS